MNIIVNGQAKELEKGTTITKLLESMAIDKKHIVAELNGSVINSEDFDSTVLNSGDKLEIVQFVGGG